MSEEVLELSVEETNKLRAELGLAPLRISNEQSQPKGQEADESKSEEEISLFTNGKQLRLRQKKYEIFCSLRLNAFPP